MNFIIQYAYFTKQPLFYDPHGETTAYRHRAIRFGSEIEAWKWAKKTRQTKDQMERIRVVEL